MLHKNCLIVGKGNSGKTTLLLELLDSCATKNNQVFMVDSATEHTDKSFIVKARSKYQFPVISTQDYNYILENDVLYNLMEKPFLTNPKTFPIDLCNKLHYNIIAFDVSFFLEESHRALKLSNKSNLRKLYNLLSAQIIYSLFHITTDKPCYILMDEIEMVPLVAKAINMFEQSSKVIFNTVRSSGYRKATFANFDIIRLPLPNN